MPGFVIVLAFLIDSIALRLRKFVLAAALVLFVAPARATPLLPTAPGTTWLYDSTDELMGQGGSAPVYATVTVVVNRSTLDDKELLRVETSSNGAVIKTELIAVNDHGMISFARGDKKGHLVNLDPPQTIVPAPLNVGAAWDLEGEVDGFTMHQHFAVEAEESVTVPAGTFRAFRLHCGGTGLTSVALDHWFVPGVGFVKKTTVVKGPGGRMLQRIILKLKKRPEIPGTLAATPTPKTTKPNERMGDAGPKIEFLPKFGEKTSALAKRLAIDVSSEPAGEMKTEFKTDVANIYVRWHGQSLPMGATVRVAWVAEDVGDIVEPDFVIDETETIAPTPDASARFTLARPPDGWAEGKYRLEFYINDELEEKIRVTILP